MTFWTLDRVAAALQAGSLLEGTVPGGTAPLAGLSTDTRTLAPGEVFVALRGERFDGHDFLAAAAGGGAAAFVVAEPARAAGLGRPVFAVRDTTAALGALARFRRRAWNGTVVAIAGSNGKTTTRELVRGALAEALNVHATRGNLNNQIGVPLTLLAIPDEADVAVVEIGTSLPGEVATLRAIAEPDVAVVTSIGEEHLEGLGDVAGVLREESAVFRDAAIAVTPAAQPEVGAVARRLARQVVEAGLERGEVRPDRWGLDAEGRGWAEYEGVRFELAVRGVHNLRNAMLALAVARACGVPAAQAARGLSGVQPIGMRVAWAAVGRLTVINDAYNANPASMREAIALLDGLATDRPKVLVLGTMRELGAAAAALHEEIARRALASRAEIVAGIGEFAGPLASLAGGSPRVIVAPDVDDLWPALAPRLAPDAVVLLKASRGVRLERLLPHLEDWASRADGNGAPGDRAPSG